MVGSMVAGSMLICKRTWCWRFLHLDAKATGSEFRHLVLTILSSLEETSRPIPAVTHVLQEGHIYSDEAAPPISAISYRGHFLPNHHTLLFEARFLKRIQSFSIYLVLLASLPWDLWVLELKLQVKSWFTQYFCWSYRYQNLGPVAFTASSVTTEQLYHPSSLLFETGSFILPGAHRFHKIHGHVNSRNLCLCFLDTEIIGIYHHVWDIWCLLGIPT